MQRNARETVRSSHVAGVRPFIRKERTVRTNAESCLTRCWAVNFVEILRKLFITRVPLNYVQVEDFEKDTKKRCDKWRDVTGHG